MVAHVYPFLKLPCCAFKSNVRMLLIQALHRALVAPCADKTRAYCAAAATRLARERLMCRQKALRWNFAACAILTRIDKKEISDAEGKAAANALLQQMPQAPTFTTVQLKDTLKRITVDETVHWDTVHRFIACAVIKRSACFAKHKTKQTLASLTRAKVAMCHRLNMKLPEDIILCDDAIETEGQDLVFCGKTTVFGVDQFVYKDRSKSTSIAAQNERAYADGDVAKMKGDAELKRKPWRIDGPPIDDGISNADFLRAMLPTLVPHISREAAGSLILVETAPDHIASDTVLAELWGKADCFDTATLCKVMPAACMRTLFQAIGVDAVCQPSVIGTIVRIFLSDMKHVDRQTNEAMTYLKARFDSDTNTIHIE